MASITDKGLKSAMELVNEHLAKLNKLIEDHNTSTSKTRDNLLNCIESNKKSNQNSGKRCKQTLNELDNQIKALVPFYNKENDEIIDKNEARIASNNETLDNYNADYKQAIDEINAQYDEVVNTENDRLENLQYLNNKELQQYIQGIDVEETAQRRELDHTINSLNFEIENLQKKLSVDINSLRHEYLIKASSYNEEMRKTRNEFIEKEKELRNISREETSSHHKQIEELTKEISATQKNILNNFSNDLLKLSNEGDQILLDYANDQIKLLSMQALNKENKRILEIEKDHNILLEKEKQETNIRNLKILKLDLDNQNTTRINRENVYSLMRISEFERESLLSDAIKENRISGMSLDTNAKINLLHEQLNDKKNDLEFFAKRFNLLRESKKKTIELYSHLYDITTTLVLDLNQLERESVLEHEKIILKKKEYEIANLNTISKLECDKELANNNLKQQNEAIELEIKKINTKFDNSIFKTRSSFNTEKTRIEHIFQMFELKLNTELQTLDNDIAFILLIASKLKDDVIKMSQTTVDELRKEKENNEKIPAFFKMMYSEFSFVKEKVDSYYENRELRITPDVDEIINDYLKASIDKKKTFENEFKELSHKTELIEQEIKDIENDIYILEANKRQLLDRQKKSYDEKMDVNDIDNQIDEKQFRLHILRLRQKSQSKDLTNIEAEISKIDEGKELLSKKENKRLYELEFTNRYYDNYLELQEIIEKMFMELNDLVNEVSAENNLKNVYTFNSKALKTLNKAINLIKSYQNTTSEDYKNEFKKISKTCQTSIEKEKKTFDINLDMINREREIAIDEEEAKRQILKRAGREYETKYNIDIVNLKIKSEEEFRELDDYLSSYDSAYGLKVAALESNASSMKNYYDDAIALENKNRTLALAKLYQQRNSNKNNYENNIARLESNYAIDKEKNASQARSRLSNVMKQYTQKALDFDMQLKQLDDVLKKSTNECNSSIIDSNTQLTDFIKKLDNSMQTDIKKTKDEITKKLKHDIKKYKIDLENKNGTLE